MILPSYLKYTNYSNEILKKYLKGMEEMFLLCAVP